MQTVWLWVYFVAKSAMCNFAIAVGCIRTNQSTRFSHSRFSNGSGIPAASRCRRVVRKISGGTTPVQHRTCHLSTASANTATSKGLMKNLLMLLPRILVSASLNFGLSFLQVRLQCGGQYRQMQKTTCTRLCDTKARTDPMPSTEYLPFPFCKLPRLRSEMIRMC